MTTAVDTVTGQLKCSVKLSAAQRPIALLCEWKMYRSSGLGSHACAHVHAREHTSTLSRRNNSTLRIARSISRSTSSRPKTALRALCSVPSTQVPPKEEAQGHHASATLQPDNATYGSNLMHRVRSEKSVNPSNPGQPSVSPQPIESPVALEGQASIKGSRGRAHRDPRLSIPLVAGILSVAVSLLLLLAYWTPQWFPKSNGVSNIYHNPV